MLVQVHASNENLTFMLNKRLLINVFFNSKTNYLNIEHANTLKAKRISTRVVVD